MDEATAARKALLLSVEARESAESEIESLQRDLRREREKNEALRARLAQAETDWKELQEEHASAWQVARGREGDDLVTAVKLMALEIDRLRAPLPSATTPGPRGTDAQWTSYITNNGRALPGTASAAQDRPTREHFRGVVWRRAAESAPTGPAYKYVVVGVLVTDRPVPGLEASEKPIDGPAHGMGAALAAAPRGEPGFVLGDATHVLTTLNQWPDPR